MLIEHRLRAPPEAAGERLDKALPSLLPQYSRARLQAWIRAGQLTLDGEAVRPRARLAGGEEIEILAEEERLEAEPEDIPLRIVHEDESLLVVNKPAGLVVHPGAGNPRGTLLNALLHRDSRAVSLPRAGLVHRLDKGTSGLLLVARTLPAHLRLVEMLGAQEVSREYQALVYGMPAQRQGRIDKPIARHPVQRTQMAVRREGRPAVTHYEVQEAFAAASHLHLRLETGRTHQIRVHLQALGHPLIGDAVYGGQLRAPKGASDALLAALRGLARPALHARALRLCHPQTGEALAFSAPPPPDFAQLYAALSSSLAPAKVQ